MIILYSGTPGSGKSLHLADLIRRWIVYYKSPVICNFDFRASCLRHKGYGGYLFVSNCDLTPDFLIWFSEKYKETRGFKRIPENHILLCLDEAQILFNARSWNEYKRKEWIYFFTQHRKFGYEIILVCQYKEMIDKQIRANIEYEYIHRKVRNIGKLGMLLSFASGGGLHVAVKIYSPLNQRVGVDFFKAKKSLYALYDSYTRFDA